MIEIDGATGRVTVLHAVRLEWAKDARGGTSPREIPGSGFDVPADLEACLRPR